jgi:hypothetical protein
VKVLPHVKPTAHVPAHALAMRLVPVKVERGAHLGLPHATPAGQHVRFVPDPQLVRPGGQPHTPLVLSTHATPLAQHVVPHGVVPDAQQQFVEGSEHVPEQHEFGPVPHTTWPAAHAASARNGLRTVAAAAVSAAPPKIFSTPRRLCGPAI